MGNLPELFLEKMEKLLGRDEFIKFLEAYDSEEDRHHALRINTGKVLDSARVLRALKCDEAEQKNGDGYERVQWEESGYYYDGSLSPGKHPYHEAGLYYIQEPSAQAVVSFLDPKPGERILDLCAAPGGKSTQAAGKMHGQGILVTNEINRDRAKILSLNIERMGIANAMVLSEDSGRLADVFGSYFDRILVDAPCSGEGMFRKNETAPSQWSPENVEMCAMRQSEILDNAARMLLPGGKLMYSTCTFSPEENEETVFKFLLAHSDFHVEDLSLNEGMENGRPQWVDTDRCLKQMEGRITSSDADIQRALEETGRSVRLWPHRVRGEGHFLCLFKRDGSTPDGGQKNYIPGGRFVRAKKEVTKAFISFVKDTFSESCPDIFDVQNMLSFGDQIYLAPADMPSPDGLKVLRPGLHLGTVKKDRFEPSHALALFLKREDVKLSCEFSSRSEKIRQFLGGQTIRLSYDEEGGLSGRKGWCLITCDGYSCGWAKLSAGSLKNHYPKGLRINYQ